MNINKTQTQKEKEQATKQVDKLIQFILSNSPPDEEWKEIHWINSNYFVSNKGRVLSLNRIKPIILKPFDCCGYLYVSINRKDWRVHRLVAKAFLSNPDGKEYVHHKDGNKQNNDVSNLAWATPTENAQAYWTSKKSQE